MGWGLHTCQSSHCSIEDLEQIEATLFEYILGGMVELVGLIFITSFYNNIIHIEGSEELSNQAGLFSEMAFQMVSDGGI